MMKVCVLRTPWLTQAIIDALRRILQALGLELVIVEAEKIQAVTSDQIVLVVIDEALDDDAEVCAGIEGALSRGGSVIGVWPPGSASGILPSIIGRKGTGVTTCDEQGMRNVTDRSSDEVWLGPGGQSLPERVLKRGGC